MTDTQDASGGASSVEYVGNAHQSDEHLKLDTVNSEVGLHTCNDHAVERSPNEGLSFVKSNTFTREATASEIRYRVEYRTVGHEVLLAKESTEDEEQLFAHTGYVFDVVNVNYTLESKDTRNSEESFKGQGSDNGDQDSGAKKPPTVEWRGRPYIRVHSRAIINALQSVVNYYPNQNLVSQPIDIPWPYAVVVHHRTELMNFLKNFDAPLSEADEGKCSVKDTSRHLQLLLNFVEEKVGDKVREAEERLQRDIPVVAFDTLWYLLRPGLDVYIRREEYNTIDYCVVSKVDFRLLDDSWNDYTVTYWILDNNVDGLIPVLFTRSLPRFHGEKPIHELNILPCEYLTTHNTQKEELIARGKLFAKLQRKRCMYFEGESIDIPHQTYRGYVMVDPVQALKELPREDEKVHNLIEQKPSKLPLCSCPRCSSIDCERTKPAKFQGYRRIALKDLSSMTDHQYSLCALAIEAFVLSTRVWAILKLTGFSEPQWREDLMDSLVLKDEKKKMLRNLCRLYVDQEAANAVTATVDDKEQKPQARPWTADYIDSKGKGLVVLLHGKPGVGKTYTAECIAHTMKRPLLSISCADIGISPPDVEKNLRKWFALARQWNAVLLIDEADIYFESRETQDLERNNLVASFLRVIEYYDGILFLTTNRIGTSDEAVWSRIHATIYYDEFKDPDRVKIWNAYFTKLRKERGNEIVVSEDARSYVESSADLKLAKWNGREIRNAFQIAVNLAQAEDSRDHKGRFEVGREHIKVTVDLLKDFKEYMLSLHQKTTEQRAFSQGVRSDAFNGGGGPMDKV